MRWDLLRVVAAAGAALQLYFAGQEMFGWGHEFVASAAPAWVGGLDAGSVPPETRSHVDWARPLAFNMGAYNLVLAVGLARIAVSGPAAAGMPGIFVSVWLLAAATAAGYTEVYKACAAQGLLGLLLLLASARAIKRTAEDGVGSHDMAFRA